jgi:flagellin
MSVINTNIGALKAANASASADKALGTAMERLSTGRRINSAKDDAAGLAIATSMTSQIRGMNQGIRNANDGISMAQTAEGALNEVTNMLQRIRELGVQAASGTYQDSDRTNLQAEVDQLTAQIDQVITNSEFNGVVLFDGSTATVTIQAGANASDTVDLTMADLTRLPPAAARPARTTSTTRRAQAPRSPRSIPSSSRSLPPAPRLAPARAVSSPRSIR